MPILFPEQQLTLTPAEAQQLEGALQTNLDTQRAAISTYLRNLANGTQIESKNLITRQFPAAEQLINSIITTKIQAGEIPNNPQIEEKAKNKLFNDALSKLIALNSNLDTQIQSLKAQALNALPNISSQINTLHQKQQELGVLLRPTALNQHATPDDQLNTLLHQTFQADLTDAINELQNFTLPPGNNTQATDLTQATQAVNQLQAQYTASITPLKKLLVDPNIGIDPARDGMAFLNQLQQSTTNSLTETFHIRPAQNALMNQLAVVNGSTLNHFDPLHNEYIRYALEKPPTEHPEHMQRYINELKTRFQVDAYETNSSCQGFTDINMPNYLSGATYFADYITSIPCYYQERAIEQYIEHIISLGKDDLPKYPSPITTCKSPFTEIAFLNEFTNELRNINNLNQNQQREIINKETGLEHQLALLAQSYNINISGNNWKNDFKADLKNKIAEDLNITLTPARDILAQSRNTYAASCAASANGLAQIPSTWFGGRIRSWIRKKSRNKTNLDFFVPEIVKEEETYRQNVMFTIEETIKQKIQQENPTNLDLTTPEQLNKYSLEIAKLITEEQAKRLEAETKASEAGRTWATGDRNEGFFSQTIRYFKHHSLLDSSITRANQLLDKLPTSLKLGATAVAIIAASAGGMTGALMIPAAMSVIRTSKWGRTLGQKFNRERRKKSTDSKTMLPKMGQSSVQDWYGKKITDPLKHMIAEQAFLSHSGRAASEITSDQTDAEKVDANQQYLKDILKTDNLDNSPFMAWMQHEIKLIINKNIKQKQKTHQRLTNTKYQEILSESITEFCRDNLEQMLSDQRLYKRRQTRRVLYGAIGGALIGSLIKAAIPPAVTGLVNGLDEHIASPVLDNLKTLKDSFFGSVDPGPVSQSVTPESPLPGTNTQPSLSAQAKTLLTNIHGPTGSTAGHATNALLSNSDQPATLAASLNSPADSLLNQSPLQDTADALKQTTDATKNQAQSVLTRLADVFSPSTTPDVTNIITPNTTLENLQGILTSNNLFPSEATAQISFPQELLQLHGNTVNNDLISTTYGKLLGIDQDVMTKALANPDNPLRIDLANISKNLAEATTSAGTKPHMVLSGDSLNWLLKHADSSHIAKLTNQLYVSPAKIAQYITNPSAWHDIVSSKLPSS